MKNLFFLTFLACWFSFSTHAQESYSTNKTIAPSSLKCAKKAKAQAQSGDFEKALKSYDKVFKKYPNYIDGHLAIGGIYFNQNKFDLAEESFKKRWN